MADDTADSLREMAQHRGLKLVKSRRRKPGTGDFGKFGLTDEQDRPLLGIGEDGLTASAEDIKNYLRAGAASTWQQSAKITPSGPVSRPRREPDEDAVEKSRPRRKVRNDADARRTDRGSRALPVPSEPAAKPLADVKIKIAPRGRTPVPREKADGARAAPNASAKPSPAIRKATPAKDEPTLILRAAKPADAPALAKLLSRLKGLSPSAGDVARELAALRKAGAIVHLAELGPLVGCVAWSLIPTLQRGPLGRISMLVVDERYRRQGIGSQLLAVAETALARKGCALIEAMSDIELKNSHNFFRTLNFEQTSYRFARKIAR